MYRASIIRSRFNAASTPVAEDLSLLSFMGDGVVGFKIAKLTQLREEESVELLMLKLPASDALITRDGSK